MKNEKYKLIKYENNGVSVDVRFDETNNTIWVTQSEIAAILELSIKSVNHHCINQEKSGATIQWDEIVQLEGNRKITRKTKLYNLDMIEAISLRSKSTSGYEFIKWVHSILNNNDEVSVLKYSPYEAIEQTYLKYYDGEISMDVKLSLNKVWLTQDQIAKLFDKDVSVISRHIKNILETGECDKSNLQKMQIPFSDKLVNIYDMDVIISVGYRVSSLRGLEFRKWSRNILKDYISEGYSINDKRCLECKTNLISLNNKVLEMEESNKKKFIEVDEENNTIWLTQSEIASVLNSTVNAVSKSINKLEKDDSVIACQANTEVIGSDGKAYKSKLYNLDMIEAISKRSKSNSAYDFIKWANDILKSNNNLSIAEFSPNEAIKSKIYDIRNTKVMLDFELAEIYGYDTRDFNNQVKNNIERFPERYRFQLTQAEVNKVLRWKISTAKLSKSRYLPYAFTEQGIYMLMTVLKGELATRQSILHN